MSVTKCNRLVLDREARLLRDAERVLHHAKLAMIEHLSPAQVEKQQMREITRHFQTLRQIQTQLELRRESLRVRRHAAKGKPVTDN